MGWDGGGEEVGIDESGAEAVEGFWIEVMSIRERVLERNMALADADGCFQN